MAGPISSQSCCFFPLRKFVVGVSLFGVACAIWTGIFVHDGDNTMAMLYGSFTTMTVVALIGTALMRLTDFRHAGRSTALLALFFFTSVLPFALHVFNHMEWSTATLPLFAAPVFLVGALEQMYHDYKELHCAQDNPAQT